MTTGVLLSSTRTSSCCPSKDFQAFRRRLRRVDRDMSSETVLRICFDQSRSDIIILWRFGKLARASVKMQGLIEINGAGKLLRPRNPEATI